MVSTKLAVRVVQIGLVLALGVWGHTENVWCSSCNGQCNGNDCFNRACVSCSSTPPPTWWGQCYAGVEGCSAYDCEEDGLCCLLYSACVNQCYCAPCA